MTILTKPNLNAKKADVIKSPLVDENNCDEEKVEIHGAEWGTSKRSSGAGALVCMTLAAALVAMTGVTCGLVLYRQYLRSSAPHRYKGYCSVPLDGDQFGGESSEALSAKPQFWSGGAGAPNLFALARDSDQEVLREEVDIDALAETISLYSSGRQVEIVHDFNNNYTGIIDEPRCFMMDLDRDTVMQPDVFVLSIERGENFDTSRVQVSLRAALPAVVGMVQRLRALRERCGTRPLYRLQRDDDAHIRKRSLDEPKPEYTQFSGKHVQEIDIENLRDVLQYEAQLQGVYLEHGLKGIKLRSVAMKLPT